MLQGPEQPLRALLLSKRRLFPMQAASMLSEPHAAYTMHDPKLDEQNYRHIGKGTEEQMPFRAFLHVS